MPKWSKSRTFWCLLSFEDHTWCRLGNVILFTLFRLKMVPLAWDWVDCIRLKRVKTRQGDKVSDTPLSTAIYNGCCGSAISRCVVAIIKNVLKQIKWAKISSVLRRLALVREPRSITNHRHLIHICSQHPEENMCLSTGNFLTSTSL